MYDLDGYLVANSAKRYAVGDSHPPLRRRADGSIVVAIQRVQALGSHGQLAASAGRRALPPRTCGSIWPRRSVLTGAWKPPPVQAVP